MVDSVLGHGLKTWILLGLFLDSMSVGADPPRNRWKRCRDRKWRNRPFIRMEGMVPMATFHSHTVGIRGMPILNISLMPAGSQDPPPV